MTEQSETSEEEYHQCHFCGEDVKDGKDSKGNRHWLSDCRPDLVKHEIGETCTWAYRRLERFNGRFKEEDSCYAYQNSDREWTGKHEHFYDDGPM